MLSLSKPALLLPVLALGGCAIAIVRVGTPERLPPGSLPPLTQRLTFDVCVTPSGSGPWQRDRETFGGLVSEALSRGGVTAELVPTPGSPSRFTISVHEVELDHELLGVLSFFTLSVLPGYVVERRTLDVNLAWRDPAMAERRDHFQYESRASSYIWAPFIVYPDYVLSFAGGWASARYRDAGFEGTFQRLADDIRDRLGREGPDTPSSEVAGVTCPRHGAPSGAR